MVKYSDEELLYFFDEIVKWRGQGLSRTKCAQIVGISETTLKRWLEKGESPRSKFHQFKIEYDKAYARWYTHHLTQANKKANTFQDHWKIVCTDEEYNIEKKIKAELNVKKPISMIEVAKRINAELTEMNDE